RGVGGRETRSAWAPTPRCRCPPRGGPAAGQRHSYDASLSLEHLASDNELLCQHARIARLHRRNLQTLRPGVGHLVALERVALVVVHGDSRVLTRVGHLPEAGGFDPLIEALVRGQTAGERNFGAELSAPGQRLDDVLAVGGLLLEFDDVLLHLQTG